MEKSATLNGKCLRKNVLHDVAVDISKTEMSSLILEGEAFVIDTELIQQGGVEVVYVYAVLHDVVAVVVGETVGSTWFCTAARDPLGEAAWVVVATEVVFGHLALAVVCTTEFSAPDNKRVLEHTA